MEETLVKVLQTDYQRYGENRVAMRRKRLGRWESYSYKDYYEAVRDLALWLVKMGLQPGDKVSVIGDNDPEWYWAELATLAAGGVAVGIYTDSLQAEMKYILQHSDSKFLVAQDQEQVDKFLSIRQEVPQVRKVVYWDPKGLWLYTDPVLASFEEARKIGKKYHLANPGLFHDLIDRGSAEDPAVICYTSGTSGLPKGVVHSHKTLLRTYADWFEVDPWRETYNYLSYVPPAWSTEQLLGITGSLVGRFTVFFPETGATVQQNIREVSPQVIFFGSRLWESMATTVELKIAEGDFLKRFFYRFFLKVGYGLIDRRSQEKGWAVLWEVMHRLGELLVYRPLRDKLGFTKATKAYTGGYGISPDIIRFFHAIGINLKQVYGVSEVLFTNSHRDRDISFETVGVPALNSEIRVTDEGAVVVRSQHQMVGYYKDPQAHSTSLEGSWFGTGDGGYVDARGHLVITGRLADVEELADGTRFPPQYVEDRLRSSPYVKDALVVGGKQMPYIIAVISIDFDAVARWAEAHRVIYTTLVSLSQNKEVARLIGTELKDLNKSLPEAFRLRRYVLLPKEFDPDEAELTRTRKLRREVVTERYRSVIDGVYEGTDIAFEAPVVYRDGRHGRVVTVIRGWSLEDNDL